MRVQMYGFCYAVSSALGRFKTQFVNRIFFESNLFQSEKMKVICSLYMS